MSNLCRGSSVCGSIKGYMRFVGENVMLMMMPSVLLIICKISSVEDCVLKPSELPKYLMLSIYSI